MDDRLVRERLADHSRNPRNHGALTEQMTGTPVPEIVEWDGETLEGLVGMELTPSRLKCAELALVAFRQAIADADRMD